MTTLAKIPTDAGSTISFNLDTTIGALEVGILVALFLSGMVTVQVWTYFHRYRHDPWGLKFVVGLCWSLELGHTIAICHTLYKITVIEYGQPQRLIIPPLSLDSAILISGFIGPLEQGWFTYRLWKLTKKVLLPLLCMVLTFTRFVGLIGLSFIALHAYPLPEYNARAGWLIESIVIVSATLDTLLVCALCYHLSSWRTDPSRVMNKIVNQIMTWTVEAGAVTILGALGFLSTYLTMKNNYVYVGFFVVIPKLFSNSLLLSLNSRERFAEVLRANSNAMAGPFMMPEFSFATGTAPFQQSFAIRTEVQDFRDDGKESAVESPIAFVGKEKINDVGTDLSCDLGFKDCTFLRVLLHQKYEAHKPEILRRQADFMRANDNKWAPFYTSFGYVTGYATISVLPVSGLGGE
ncbi:hypothetical protein C8R44DRAFT_885323 [Mycena epipterygia]|nr:hypothetical protein C8R44DRAFT_885323 [Mycena epipterygia]